MDFRTRCVALLLCSLPMAGCGTFTNIVCSPPAQGGKTPFGGVRHDVACIHNPETDHSPKVAPVLCSAADLPLSLVGDVVTWPYTAAYSFINQPVPVPPVTHGPTLPPQTPPESRPATPPLETLPEPRTLR